MITFQFALIRNYWKKLFHMALPIYDNYNEFCGRLFSFRKQGQKWTNLKNIRFIWHILAYRNFFFKIWVYVLLKRDGRTAQSKRHLLSFIDKYCKKNNCVFQSWSKWQSSFQAFDWVCQVFFFAPPHFMFYSKNVLCIKF